MTCPNCKSTDIIGIQGQHYCINCGQQVPDEVTKPAAAPPEIVEAIKATPLQFSSPTKGLSAAKITPLAKESSLPEVQSGASLKPVPASIHRAQHQKRSMDMKKAPKKPLAAASTIVADTADTVIVKPIDNADTTVAPPIKSIFSATAKASVKADPQMAPNHPARTAWHIVTTKFWPLLFLYSTALAIIQLGLRLRLSPELVNWMPHFINIHGLNAASLHRDITIGLIAAICACSLYFFRTYVNAKLIFTTTKQLDNRAIGPKQANLIAADSLWGLIGLDVLTLFWLVGLVIVELGLVRGVNLISLNGLIQPALLTIGNFVIIYAGLGMVIARLLAQRLLVMSGKPPGAALRLGWRMFEHHSGDLLLWALQAGMVSFILMAPLSLMIRALASGSLASTPTTSTLGLIVVAGSLSYYLVSAFNIGFWTSSYHALVDRVEASQRQLLMTGRQPKAGLANSARILAILILLAATFLAGLYYRDTLVRDLLPYLQNRP